MNLIRNIMIRFVKPSVMLGKGLLDVDYKLPYNVKEDSELVIGEVTVLEQFCLYQITDFSSCFQLIDGICLEWIKFGLLLDISKMVVDI